ncbi:MAG: prepilin-type N-terminal cleavage/methylation domain-containing protein [Methylococcales bacterium]
MNRIKTAPGFTLIEVLIAMTLLSVMVVLLFASLRICGQSWEQGEDKIAEVNDVAAVYNFFQQHLAAAKPVINDFAEENVGSFAFQGEAQSLSFVSALPASVGRDGLQQFSLQFLQKDNDQYIKVVLTPFFPVAEGEQWRKDDAILIKHVSNFELSYFGSEDGISEGAWMSEWLDKEVQPQLVKIKIDLDNGSYWPEMVIKLNVSGVYSNEDFETEVTDENEESDADTGVEQILPNGEIQ